MRLKRVELGRLEREQVGREVADAVDPDVEEPVVLARRLEDPDADDARAALHGDPLGLDGEAVRAGGQLVQELDVQDLRVGRVDLEVVDAVQRRMPEERRAPHTLVLADHGFLEERHVAAPKVSTRRSPPTRRR